MRHTRKIRERVLESKKKRLDVQRPTVQFHNEEEHYRYEFCFESVDGEVRSAAIEQMWSGGVFP